MTMAYEECWAIDTAIAANFALAKLRAWAQLRCFCV